MYPISILRFTCRAVTLALVAVTGLQQVDAQEPQAPGVPEVSCSVTDEQIVAATARHSVKLDTEACTVSLKRMVAYTFSDIQKDYAVFYEQTHLNPAAIADISFLLVRRQLLSGGWSSAHIEHHAVSKDPALLNEIEARLHVYLTPQQVAALKAYEETIPARRLVEPVVSRLQKAGRPLSELPYVAALQAVQQFFADWRKSGPAEEATDPRERCMASHAHMTQRDEGIREILARSLDEEQLQIADGYYRDLIERRARSFRMYESNEVAICAIPAL